MGLNLFQFHQIATDVLELKTAVTVVLEDLSKNCSWKNQKKSFYKTDVELIYQHNFAFNNPESILLRLCISTDRHQPESIKVSNDLNKWFSCKTFLYFL